MAPVDSRQAETRILRTVVAIFGVTSCAFFALTLPSVAAQWPYIAPVWSICAVAVIFGGPPVMAIVCQRCDAATIKAMFGGYAIASLVITLSLVLWLGDERMPFGLNPWPLTIVALATVPAALAFRERLAYGYLVVYSVVAGIVRYTAGEDAVVAVAVQDALFAFTLAGLFTALAIVTMRTARALDSAARSARDTAVRRAGAESRLREQARLDALLHDDVMSTLFYASTGAPELEAAVRRQATRALTELRAAEEVRDDLVDVAVFTSRLRSVALEGAGEAPIGFEVRGRREAPVPAAVDAAFAEAAGEAVRNSLKHAGIGASRSVTLSLADDRVALSVVDDGVGFETRDVKPHRLGIAVSIRGRMAAVAGGSARIEAGRGRGVRVELEWIPA